MKIIHKEEINRFITNVAFLIENYCGGKKAVFDFVKEEITELEPGGIIPESCIIKIPNDLFSDMIKGFAELANEKGLKLDSDLKREGQLEATKYHLEDLRTILKLKKNV